MNIIGVSAFYHDSAACLVSDGVIISAAQEERFSRIKHDSAFPLNSIKYCMEQGGVSPNQIDYVVFYDKPILKFDRLIETYLAYAPKGIKSFVKAIPLWMKDKLFQKDNIISQLFDNISDDVDWHSKLLFSEHHLSHAASAFYPSPFKDAAVLTMDGVGEWVTTSLAIGNGNHISINKELHFPHSLGLLYSAFTYFCGFKVNSGEYKLMGLAPYGNPLYADLIRNHLIDIKSDGSFHLNMKYFDYCFGLTMTNHHFNELVGGEPRAPEDLLTQREMDLAASIQVVTEEVMLKLSRNIRKITGMSNLCMAGGVALNCVANGKLLKEGIFESIWVQPASGDAGGAIGAALSLYFQVLNNPRFSDEIHDGMRGAFLGPSYSQAQVESRLKQIGAKFIVLKDEELIEHVASALVAGMAVGWHQGRAEFGPRSLGARSILADPRSTEMQKQLNLKVKFRESFRPFAPSITNEDLMDWFDINANSPYMLFVAEVTKDKQIKMTESQMDLFGIQKLNISRSLVPAVTHVDYSARIQSVGAEENKKFHSLLSVFKEKTGCPILVNTSFNIRGEPMVLSPEDSFRCFMGTNLDVLVVENCMLYKNDQDNNLMHDYRDQHALD